MVSWTTGPMTCWGGEKWSWTPIQSRRVPEVCPLDSRVDQQSLMEAIRWRGGRPHCRGFSTRRDNRRKSQKKPPPTKEKTFNEEKEKVEMGKTVDYILLWASKAVRRGTSSGSSGRLLSSSHHCLTSDVCQLDVSFFLFWTYSSTWSQVQEIWRRKRWSRRCANRSWNSSPMAPIQRRSRLSPPNSPHRLSRMNWSYWQRRGNRWK